jgi:hypothetical protein
LIFCFKHQVTFLIQVINYSFNSTLKMIYGAYGLGLGYGYGLGLGYGRIGYGLW